MEVCPTEVLFAPADRIWHLLVDARQLAQWTGTRLVEAPTGELSAGDRLVFRVGVWRITFDVRDVHPPRELVIDVGLPFGVTNHEQIRIMPIDAQSSRVTFD